MVHTMDSIVYGWCEFLKCEKSAEHFFWAIKSNSESWIGCSFCKQEFCKNFESRDDLSRLVCTEKPPIDDSRDHDDHVTNSKTQK